MPHRILALAAATLLTSSAFAQPTDAPATPPTESKPAGKPKKPVYDEQADAKQQIAAALSSAKANNRRVLIQWGGNWCSWCLLLDKTMKSDKDLAKELNYEYDVVHVDAGAKDKNVAFAADTYQADLKKNGFPYLTILDADGKVLANQETSSLESKDANGESVLGAGQGHDAKKVLAFLKKYEATPQDAKPLLDAAFAEAKSSSRSVFLHFGAPWCPWCHRLENWMAKPEVAALLKKDFVPLKLDVDRNPGAAAILKSTRGTDAGSIPWYALLAPDGKVIATSTVGKDNIGFPASTEEIEEFCIMLRKGARNITSGEIDSIAASLKSDKPAQH